MWFFRNYWGTRTPEGLKEQLTPFVERESFLIFRCSEHWARPFLGPCSIPFKWAAIFVIPCSSSLALRCLSSIFLESSNSRCLTWVCRLSMVDLSASLSPDRASKCSRAEITWKKIEDITWNYICLFSCVKKSFTWGIMQWNFGSVIPTTYMVESLKQEKNAKDPKQQVFATWSVLSPTLFAFFVKI